MKTLKNFKKLIAFLFLMLLSYSIYSEITDEKLQQGVNEKSLKVKLKIFSKIINSAETKKTKKFLALYNRGVVYYNQNDYKNSLHDFLTALKLRPEDPDTIKNIGIIFLETKRYANALDKFSKLIDINSSASEPYFLRGNVFLTWQKHEKAIKDYSQAIKLNSEYVNALINRGWANISLKKFGKALEDFERVLNINPEEESAVKGKEKILELLDSIQE